MDIVATRTAATGLAESLGWLAHHLRGSSPNQAATVDFAAALVRNVLGPYLERFPPTPLHVAVVGGAGAGKSTVVNCLLGVPAAETNPQAGYTRHPTAFVAAAAAPWPQTPGFLDGLQPADTTCPANTDRDIYQVRRLPTPHPLDGCVIWDCPDMTTWAATHYVRRLMEVAALADVIVYVASDERYNDRVPTEFLELMVRAGKTLMVVLTKVREDQASLLVDHFRREVLGRLPCAADGTRPGLPVVVLPWLSEEERSDFAKAGAARRVPLLNQLLALCDEGASRRLRNVRNALEFVNLVVRHLHEMFRDDLQQYAAWQRLVADGRRELERRYENEYLRVEPFAVLERCREQLLELMELPGAGRWWSGTLGLLRTPYRLLRNQVRRWWQAAAEVPRPERDVLDAACTAWQNALHAQVLQRTAEHPFWKELAGRFEHSLKPAWNDIYRQLLNQYFQQEGEDLAQRCQSLLQSVEQHRGTRAALCGGKALLDAGAIAAVVYGTWPLDWYHLVLVPLSVSVTQQLAEWGVGMRLEALRRTLRQRRVEILQATITGPLEQWLRQWPAQADTPLERLQQCLEEAPQQLQVLQTAIYPPPGTSPETPTVSQDQPKP